MPTLARISTLFMFGAMLAGCGGGSSSSGGSPVSAPATTTPVAQNRSPVISGSPVPAAVVGAEYAFQPVASDPVGDPLTFGISARPAWARFDPATGRLAGTPRESAAGTFSGVVITVSDGQASASMPSFDIAVRAQIGAAALASRIEFNDPRTLTYAVQGLGAGTW
jgi:hypothetical protein